MAKKMLIDAAHPEETRVVVVHGNRIEEFDFESAAKKQLRGNIYLAKVTRVEPSLQAAFVDYGGNRHGFLAFSEIHPDYYQIPVADRQALLEEQAAEERRLAEEDDFSAGDETSSRRNNAGNGNGRRRGGRRRYRRRSDRITCRITDVETDTFTATGGSGSIERDWNRDRDDDTPLLEIGPGGPEDAEAKSLTLPHDLDVEADGNDKTTDDALVVDVAAAEETEASVSIVGGSAPHPQGFGEDADDLVVEVTDAQADDETDATTSLTSPQQTVDIESAPRGRRRRGGRYRSRSDNGADDDDDASDRDECDQDDDDDDMQASDSLDDEDADDVDEADSEDDEQSAHGYAEDTDEDDKDSEVEDETDSPDRVTAASAENEERATGSDDGEERVEAAPLRQSSDEVVRSEPLDEGEEDASPADASAGEPAMTDSEASQEGPQEGEDFEGDSVDRVRQLLKKGVGLPPKKNEPEPEPGLEDFFDDFELMPPGQSQMPTAKTDVPDADEEAEAEDDTEEETDIIETAGNDDILEDEEQRRKVRVRNYKIQEVIKRRQILLVQVVKEERGNKGAALTTYLSIAGRYCVLMPNTARGGGISRKITNPADRKRLKEVAGSLEVPEGMGLIVRTAGANRTKVEVKRDYEYLLRLWENVRDLTLKSTAPTLVYEESNLVKRSIRDLYGKDIDNIQVEGEDAYKEAKAFMRMLMPSHAKNVQPYRDRIPLFQRYQVETHLDSMFSPTVELPSGGYLVINPTEALVAIDVNSGKSTKEHSIEETALRTNLEAAEEVARQLRLRDLAGLIVIDFIDMEENRNNRAVEKKLKDCLKTDRARLQIGRISVFGLLEMSRQRLRAGVLEGSTQICPHCEGSGKIRSVESLALRVLRVCEEEGLRERTASVDIRLPTDVAVYVLNQKRRQLMDIENLYGLVVNIEADPAMLASDFTMQRGEPLSKANRPQRQEDTAVSMETAYDDSPAEEDPQAQAESEEDDESNESRGRKRGRRGRRRRSDRRDDNGEYQADASDDNEDDDDDDNDSQGLDASGDDSETGDDDENADRPRRRRRRGKRGGRRNRRTASGENESENADAETDDDSDDTAEENPQTGTNQDIAASAGEDDGNAQTPDGQTEEIRVAVEPTPAGDDDQSAESEPSIAAGDEPQAAYVNGHETTADEKPGEDDSHLAAESDDKDAASKSTETIMPEPEPEPTGPKRTGWWQRRA